MVKKNMSELQLEKYGTCHIIFSSSSLSNFNDMKIKNNDISQFFFIVLEKEANQNPESSLYCDLIGKYFSTCESCTLIFFY